MDQSVRDYIQYQGLLLPFESTLDELVQSTLAAPPQEYVDLDDDDDCFVRNLSGGSLGGVSEERWVLSEGELGMVKRMRKGLRRVEDQQRVDANVWMFPPYLSDDFLLPRSTRDDPPFLLPSQQPAIPQESFHATISRLFDLMGSAMPEDDEQMETLERMPPVDEALDLKLAATRAQVDCLRKSVGILSRKKGSPVVDAAASLIEQGNEGLLTTVPDATIAPENRPGSPPIFARPPTSPELDILPSKDNIQDLLVGTLNGPINQQFSSPTGKGVGMKEWNKCEGIMNSDDLPSPGGVEPKTSNKIWSSPPPQSTPPSAETFEIDTAIFPRTAIKVEEEDDDFMISYITIDPCSDPDAQDEEIDELADDETVPGLWQDLAVVLAASRPQPFSEDMIDTGGLATSLIVEARLPILFLPPLSTEYFLPDSIHDFAPDSGTIWALQRTTGIPSLTIELGWQAWVTREGETVRGVCEQGEEGDEEQMEAVKRAELAMREEFEEESLVDWEAPPPSTTIEEDENLLIPRCEPMDQDLSVNSFHSSPPSTIPLSILNSPVRCEPSVATASPIAYEDDDSAVRDDDLAMRGFPATQYPMMYEDDVKVRSPTRDDALEATDCRPVDFDEFIYPKSSSPEEGEMPQDDQKSTFDSPAINSVPQEFDVCLDAVVLTQSSKVGRTSSATMNPEAVLPTSSWTSSDALSRFLGTRGRKVSRKTSQLDLHLPSAPTSTTDVPPPPQYLVPLLHLPISTPAFLTDDSLEYQESSRSYRIIATPALLQLRAHFEALTSQNIILVDRPPRYTPQPHTTQEPHLIVNGTTAVLFHPLIRIVGNAVRPQVDGTVLTRDESLWTTLERLSNTFNHLVVVLEEKDALTRSTRPFAYTPPVLNALSQLVLAADDHRSDGSICEIEFAIARNPEDSARVVRRLLEYLKQFSATRGDDRAWLTDDPTEDEEQLLQADQLNPFSACAILSQCSVAEFVSVSREDRLHAFGEVCGVDRINGISDLLAANQQHVVLPPSPTSDGGFIDIDTKMDDQVGTEVFDWYRYEETGSSWSYQ